MSKNKRTVLILLLAVIVIASAPLLFIHNSEFGGSDDAAEGVVSELTPDYKPWASSILQPPGSETESLLFSLEAGIGSGILGFGFGYLVCRKKNGKG
ncbi:Cobalt transport protein CbiN [Ruminococcaceae bacterium BL-6]|nr:Cobalt transport protein CbiN [Ruminococcaceae bacterium BL-6]